jgi:hypothetical protein
MFRKHNKHPFKMKTLKEKSGGVKGEFSEHEYFFKTECDERKVTSGTLLDYPTIFCAT